MRDLGPTICCRLRSPVWMWNMWHYFFFFTWVF